MSEPTRLEIALRQLIDASEELASSDPIMPSHARTVEEFEAALENAKQVLDGGEQ